METMKLNVIKAKQLLLHITPFIADEDWTDVLQEMEVCNLTWLIRSI